VEYLREVGKVDSAQIVKLNGYLRHMDATIDLCEESNYHYKSAYTELQKSNKILQKQIRMAKARGWIGGVFGSVGAFGAGVGITFLILKL
jgi:hypothetical protein